MDKTNLWQLFLAALGVLTPLFLWYLNRSYNQIEIDKSNKHLKRLELLEKLDSFNSKLNLTESPANSDFFREEISKIKDDLQQQKRDSRDIKISNYSELGNSRKFFLIFKPSSSIVIILATVFYMCFFLTLILLLNVISQINAKKIDIIMFIFLIFYIGITYLFSYWANKYQKEYAFKKSQ